MKTKISHLARSASFAAVSGYITASTKTGHGSITHHGSIKHIACDGRLAMGAKKGKRKRRGGVTWLVVLRVQKMLHLFTILL